MRLHRTCCRLASDSSWLSSPSRVDSSIWLRTSAACDGVPGQACGARRARRAISDARSPNMAATSSDVSLRSARASSCSGLAPGASSCWRRQRETHALCELRV